jgi:hypothetical protein
MAKGDVERPALPPRKRRELERALPVWLASWANDESIPEPDRRRAQAERDRRKDAGAVQLVVGLVIGPDGATPPQVEAMREVVSSPTVVKVMSPRPLKLGLPPNTFVLETDLREIVKTADLVVAAPRQVRKPVMVTGVWEEVRHAKQLGVPVKVVLADGELHR